MPFTKRWSIATRTGDGIVLSLKCHFSRSQARRVYHTKQERVCACFVLTQTCWWEDASHQYSVTKPVIFALELQLSSNVLGQIIFRSRTLSSSSQNSTPSVGAKLFEIIPIQWITINKSNRAFHWIAIYPVDSVIHPFKQLGRVV